MAAAAGPGRIFIGFRASRDDLGGGNRTDRVCSETLEAEFEIARSRDQADLQICSQSWQAPQDPPRVFIDHGSFADASFWTYTAPRLRTSDTILVSSSVCVRVAERCFGEAAPLIRCVPFSIDIDVFRPAEDRASVRRQIADGSGIPADGPLLLVASSFVRRKNLHLAVLFLEALLEEIPEARMAMAGGTPDSPRNRAYRAAVEDLARARGLGSRLHFVGAVPQAHLARLMGASDLLVHMTNCRLENFGLVVGEAMAAGLPVVAADWGGLRDLVVPGETGFLARTFLTQGGPRTDWLSVVEPAAAILRERAVWDEASRRSRLEAERYLSREAYRRRLRAAVIEALSRGAGAAGPVALSVAATELSFRTIHLNATHPEIEDSGDEYRLLMPLDGGAHSRFLSGPAATSDRPPTVHGGDRLYPVVTWIPGPGGIRVTDASWPGLVQVESVQVDLLRSCDGAKTLEEVLDELRIPPEGRPEARRRAQALVDQGILGPLGCAAGR
jgi:glycosyltransferase involved in cell wall biosynthesis